MNRLIKQELDNLEIQFPGQSQINLDEYADLYKIGRKDASRHVRRRNIPVTKEGRNLYISMIDLATYKAKRKSGNEVLFIAPNDEKSKTKRRRGFCQTVERRQVGN